MTFIVTFVKFLFKDNFFIIKSLYLLFFGKKMRDAESFLPRRRILGMRQTIVNLNFGFICLEGSHM